MQHRQIKRYTTPNVSTTIHPHALVDRVLKNRGVTEVEQADYGLKQLTPYNAGGMQAAVKLLAEALAQRWKILIVGDFDADGATSTVVAIRALKSMGCEHIAYLVPNRFDFGYGLSPALVDVAAGSTDKPDLIVTVDNGVSSIDGVARANELGIQVLVTDHHLPGAELPDAQAILNPNCNDDDFPCKALAGVGVVFYLMVALRSYLRRSGWFDKQPLAEPNLAELLDLVALGTVADVVPLQHTNRILVAQGLRRIRSGKCVAGIMALIKVAGRDWRQLSSSDLGFALGPRLNAAGRLDDMSVGIETLLTDDAQRATAMAQQLDALNKERRAREADMVNDAMFFVDEITRKAAGEIPNTFTLYEKDWHQGIVGLVASRTKEKFHRPVIAFANESGAGSALKGSARSIPGLHIRDALEHISTQNPGLIDKFGGHAMAAGLSLRADHLGDFAKAFEQVVTEMLTPDALAQVIWSDGELQARDFSLLTAETLAAAGPWGQEFAEPLFDGVFDVQNTRIVGENHLKLSVVPEGGASPIDGIYFRGADYQSICDAGRVRIVYHLDVNEYNGLRKPQLLIDYIASL